MSSCSPRLGQGSTLLETFPALSAQRAELCQGGVVGPGHKEGSGKLGYLSPIATPASTHTPHRLRYTIHLTQKRF